MGFRVSLAIAALVACTVVQCYGGTIAGKVTFEGTPPKIKPLTMDADPKCCAADSGPKFSEVLVLGDSQTMGNILVQIAKGLPDKDYPLPSEPVILNQHGCVYTPHVFVLRPAQTLKILNPDATFHNVHALPQVNKAFNRAMPATVAEIETSFPEPEPPFMFQCDVHDWMGAWCAVLDHPFYAVTAEDGVFKIEGLDAGEYEVQAWHERLGTQTATVTVGADETKTVDFTFALKK